MADGNKSGKAGKKLLAIALVAVLAIAGMAAIGLVEANQSAATNSVTQGSTQTNGIYLEVVVWANVNGHRTAVPDANVTIYSVSWAETSNGSINITLTPAAKGVTNSHGAVYFNLPGGRYALIAHEAGLRGAALLDLRFYTTKFVRLNPAQNTTA